MTGTWHIIPILAALSIVPAGAGQAACPEKESGDGGVSVTYANRGDRCEGLFRQQVAASAQLTLLGVHSHEPLFTAGSGKPLTVATAYRGGSAASLNLRVLSSRTRLYYRMDTSFAPGTRFLWKRDVIDDPSVRLQPTEMKALLCEGSCSSREPVVAPVSISESAQTPPKQGGITFWFRAAVELKQLFVTIENQGSKTAVMKNEDVLEGRLLPAGAAKDVFVPLKKGAYTLRATAVPSGDNARDQARAKIIVP